LARILGSGYARNSDGLEQVIFAGGHTTSGGDERTVEILNLQTNEWKMAEEKAPHHFIGSMSVQFEDTFWLIGGIDRGEDGETTTYTDTIYRQA